ncbi:hypothetical protein MYMA111404_04020 [Mycoplasma marinum]|uniref:Uncharacterized protein n=1 Tax=Mycoplasma marinum TaxID=1937190 RepID=A0A4R0XTC5_9MOLU|nr:hypothetical protein [Mycoplasma marinum]TCG10879.1 hypothetical protein C4B24_03645 [Mycoplasma marinum]
MKLNKSNSRILYKKLRYLLKSLFIDIELIKFLSHKQLYKFLYRTTKFDERFNFSKKELKILVDQIIDFNFEDRKAKETSLIQEFVSYIIKIIKTKVQKLKLKPIEKPFVSFFIDEHPMTLE